MPTKSGIDRSWGSGTAAVARISPSQSRSAAVGRVEIGAARIAQRYRQHGAQSSTRPTISVTVATLFTRIIDGELPGTFVWRDERCVSFLSINPVRPGHALMVPRAEVDHWIDLEPGLARHLITVPQTPARAQHRAIAPTRIGLVVAGMEVPHAHVHLIPIGSEADPHPPNAASSVAPEELDQAAPGPP